MLTNNALPSGDSVIPVTSQSLGPTRKRRNLAAPGAAPVGEFTVRVALVASVPVMDLTVPSPTAPGSAASNMQLVTSV